MVAQARRKPVHGGTGSGQGERARYEQPLVEPQFSHL